MKTKNSFAVLSAIALAAAFTTNVYAQTTMSKDSMPGMDMSGMKMAPKDKGGMAGMNMPGMAMDKSAAATAAEGEVRKIDKENQKITLKHGDIKNLDMPGMTMVFKVKDAALLDKVQVGSKVRFNAEKSDGAIVVTNMEIAP